MHTCNVGGDPYAFLGLGREDKVYDDEWCVLSRGTGSGFFLGMPIVSIHPYMHACNAGLQLHGSIWRTVARVLLFECSSGSVMAR
jgi:hypothetical protein